MGSGLGCYMGREFEHLLKDTINAMPSEIGLHAHTKYVEVRGKAV